jgi:hypothetical protein
MGVVVTDGLLPGNVFPLKEGLSELRRFPDGLKRWGAKKNHP